MSIKTSFLKKEHVDSGLALLLLTLIMGFWLNHQQEALLAAVAVVLILLIAPVIIYPFSFLWLNLSDMLGRIMSKIILTAIFIVFVCPVAILRRAMGKDSLMLKKFKSSEGSVFTNRSHDQTKTDFTAQF
ncbi:MAG: hypothetical protein A2066_09760 [Bacteroidetes bacterium GWB2_41_8]|nr:MAG: hypothetical protein A2066_09760 [Bacteroidetes bacterium GWB2_41_8]